MPQARKYRRLHPGYGAHPREFRFCRTYHDRVQRVLSLRFENGKVTFLWKDYAKGNDTKAMTFGAVEFIRRFLLHVLPPDSFASGSMAF